MFCDCRMSIQDTVKIYDELRTDLVAAFPLVTRSVSASLVESEAVKHAVEAKCWQTMQKKFDVLTKKMNAEQKSKADKLQRELDQKSKVD